MAEANLAIRAEVGQQRLRRMESQHTRRRIIDWTRPDYAGELSEHTAALRARDWETTSLGPISSWPLALRQAVVGPLANREPRLILWGSQQTVLYNEAFMQLTTCNQASDLDPIGRPFSESLPELWHQIGPMVELSALEGQATRVSQLQITLYRHGYPEDTYWYMSLIPILGEDGYAAGVTGEFQDCTSIVIGERRSAFAHQLRKETAESEDLTHLWKILIRLLRENTDDCPFALMYSVGDLPAEENPDDRPNLRSSRSYLHSATASDLCTLQGSVRVPNSSKAVYESFRYHDLSHPYASAFQSAASTRSIIHLSERNQQRTFTPTLKQLIYDSATHDPSPDVVVVALPPIIGPGVYGFLIVGLNPRTPFDEDYKLFFRLVGDVLVNAITSMTLPQEQRQVVIAAEEAALRHASLLRQLAMRTREMERSEARFTRMAQQAPVGMLILKPDQTPIYLNDAYKKLMPIEETHSGDTAKIELWWHDFVHPEDQALVRNMWDLMIQERKPVRFEHRLSRSWEAVNETTGAQMTGEFWVLAILYPEINTDGSCETVMGWVADVSAQHWSSTLQARRLEEMVESERQKEQYIDRTSHEIRNPLGAMLNAADLILDSLQDAYDRCAKDDLTAVTLSKETTESLIDATENIQLCINHQKRIVDDVLTLSKLDSSLLKLSPEAVSPQVLVQQAMKMFDLECRDSNIDINIDTDASYEELCVDKVFLDPSRVQQVLINILTNAIKFTKDRPQRRIKVKLSASLTRPDGDLAERYFPSHRKTQPECQPSKGAEAEHIYIRWEISDTGSGLSQEEINTLFTRFQQGSARTYNKYGGSGLGLTISKDLVELQGGQIGVSSEKGYGTTFAFYVEASRIVSDNKDSTLSGIRSSSPHKGGAKELNGLADSNTANPATQPSTFLADETGSLLSTPQVSDMQMHVLVVEDNIVNQKLLAKQLRKAGCTVDVANDGLEAVQYMEKTTSVKQLPEHSAIEHVPSVILMDIHMPVLDGLQATDRIRELEKTGHLPGRIPIIAVTANARSEQKTEAVDHGMDCVVTKPFRVPDLLKQMRSIVAKSAQQRTHEVPT